MAKPSRFNCKVEGCKKALHYYPNGTKAAYCDDHLKLRKTHRKGHPNMTASMKQALQRLRVSNGEFIALQDISYRTIPVLIERDWIIEGPGLNDEHYMITGRGLKELAFYEQPLARKDGLCPRCGKQKRHVRKSGVVNAYCAKCESALIKEKKARGVRKINPNRCCSRCHRRALHQYPGGEYSTYCKHCERVNRRRNARKLRKRLFKSIQAGAPIPLCKLCKERPRRVFPHSISELCTDCGKEQIRKSLARKVMRNASRS